MPRIIPSVGTPADRYAFNWHPSYREKAVWKLRKFAAWVAEVTFGCAHRHVTLPYNDRQTCLDCGASRLYIYNTEMYLVGLTDTPIFKGRWKKAVPAAITIHSAAAAPKPETAVQG